MNLLLLILCASGDYFDRERFHALPPWAAAHAEAMVVEEAPKGAQVWRLLDETILGFDTDGNLMVRHRIVQAVLHQGGAEAAAGYAQGVNEDVGSVLRITGWHLPRSGPLQKVDQDDMVTYGTSTPGMINRGAVTATGFEFVSKGSVVAFESVKKEKHYLGAVGFYPMMGPHPTKEYRIKLVEEGGEGEHVRLVTRGLKTWKIRSERLKNELIAYHLPGLENVPMRAPYPDSYPYVTAQFLATEEDRQRYKDWDHYARWYWGVFKDVALPNGAPALGEVDIETLKRMGEPLRERITYQQVYLSNARGYVPEHGEEVMRRAYGDCKDMASCFAHMGEKEQVRVLPVLANIVNGAMYSGKNHPYPLFNHLICAVPLKESLGLPAEVVVNNKRYLIFDATAADTAFGYMPRGYLGRSVLICTPQGAVWADIPEKALEPGKAHFRLSGQLDAQQSLSGTLTLIETGNALSFRTLVRRYGARLATLQLRAQMPPQVRLDLESSNIQPNGDTLITWKIQWPGFLKPAGPGYRLPQMILPSMDTPLRVANRPRTMPILIPDQPLTFWELDLAQEVPLQPLDTQASAQQNFWQYQWEAKGGTRLQLKFQRSLKQTIYAHHQTGTGVKDWHQFQDSYHQFLRDKAIFVP